MYSRVRGRSSTLPPHAPSPSAARTIRRLARDIAADDTSSRRVTSGERGDGIDPSRGRVQRRHEHEIFPAGRNELFLRAHADLLDRLETIRDECGAQDRE